MSETGLSPPNYVFKAKMKVIESHYPVSATCYHSGRCSAGVTSSHSGSSSPAADDSINFRRAAV